MLAQDDVIAGRYRLVRLIASGGMGVVWQGRDERLQRTVAIKVLRPPSIAPADSADAAEAAQRALREARITARLHHPNAVAVFDVVDEAGLPCLIMEYLPSVTLATQIETCGPLPVPRVIEIGRQVAAGLVAAHNAGIVHRDVKPANILLAEDDLAKITDFGISHALGDVTLTSTGLITGTPAYLAPEVARGQESDATSDVFSLGGTLFAAVEGRAPYGTDVNPMALLHRIASGQPFASRQAGVLTALLRAMLDTDRGARPTMPEVERELRALASRDTGTGQNDTEAITRAIPHAPPVRTAPQHVQPAAATWTAADTDPIADDDHPGRFAAWAVRAAGVAVVLLILVAGLILWGGPGDPGRSDAQDVPVDASQSTSSASLDPAEPTVPVSPTDVDAPSEPAATVPGASPPATAAPSTESTAGSPPAPGAVPADQAIRDYYAIMPAAVDAGWARLTSDYQRNHVQGLDAYREFWAQIRGVELGEIQPNGPGSVTATITYDYLDGRRYVEVTRFTVASEDGATKIASSAVL